MGRLKQELNIRTRIHVFRAEHRLTQDDLAQKVGVTRATINALEQGNYNPSLELAFRIARYFKTSIEDIFKIEEKKK